MDRRPRWIKLLSLLALFIAPSLVAQQSPPTGRIAGRAVDGTTGAPIPASQVTLEGTPITSIADWAGRYLLDGVAPGTHTVSVRMIGYRPKTVTGVVVIAAAVTPLDVTLTAARRYPLVPGVDGLHAQLSFPTLARHPAAVARPSSGCQVAEASPARLSAFQAAVTIS
jgi:hypothetical protein